VSKLPLTEDHHPPQTELATSIAGSHRSAILAETGDPHRFASGRSPVKHAGLAPPEKLSGSFVGRTKLTGPTRTRLGPLASK
jgi:transposase